MKLSIVVTNYNYAHFLEEAVSSLYQNLSLDSFEVILVDDGSTDNSREIIHKLSGRFPTLRPFFHKNNLGQHEAFETAFKHVRGEYIHPFASDDVMLPGSIDTLLDYFRRHPDVPAFCSDNSYFYKSDPNPILLISKLLKTTDFHYFPPETVFELFSHTDFWIPGHTLFAKTKSYLKYTPFDKKLRFVLDWWANHRLALNEGIGYIPQAISAQRKHSSSFSSVPSLEKRKEVWLHLFGILEENPQEFRGLSHSGIFRMFGLKAIYKELIKTPRYWKYLMPMLRKIGEKKLGLSNWYESRLLNSVNL